VLSIIKPIFVALGVCTRPPVLFLWLCLSPEKLRVEVRGIPHLAKNEQDVGHPSFVVGIGFGAPLRGMPVPVE
jgi:hypothetical protein